MTACKMTEDTAKSIENGIWENNGRIHVTHNGKRASAKTIESFIGKNEVLNDLGIRASDLLQANGIVWLEGPSDRVYFNKWIEIFSNGELQEHRHYECVFYGGSLLSHHGVDETDTVNADFVNILKINRNFILIADSDKTSATSRLKPRLKQIVEMSKDIVPKQNVWITKVKEIENYIPVESSRRLFGKDNLEPIKQHEIFHSETKECYWKHSPKKTFDKVKFASEVIATYPKDRDEAMKWLNQYDLNDKMVSFCKIIRSWNHEHEKASNT